MTIRVASGVLVGGKSSRMGEPKATLRHEGRTLLETVVDNQLAVPLDVTLLGAGHVPEVMRTLETLPDDSRANGPMAGVLSALVSNRADVWWIVGCDQPDLGSDAFQWAWAQWRPGMHALLPQRGDGVVEPLGALYSSGFGAVLADRAARNELALRKLTHEPKVVSPTIPEPLADQWRSLNTPDDWEKWRSSNTD